MVWLLMATSPMTFTLDFQGQILKKSYLRNGMADWHGTKRTWVDRMLHPLCDFECPLHPWPLPWIFKVKFWKWCISGMVGQIDMDQKGFESDRILNPCCDFQCSPLPWAWPWIFKVKFWKCRISRMGWPIDIQRKGCESTSIFDLTHDLDLIFSRLNIEIAVI